MLDNLLTLKASTRSGRGKGAAGRTRRAGSLPGVVYGGGADSLSITVEPKEIEVVLRTPYGFNNVFNVSIDGAPPKLCMLRERQFSPVRRVLTHVDFLVVSPDRFVVIEAPVQTEGRSEGEKQGGRLQIVARSIRVRCRVRDIPAAVTIDVSPMGLDQSMYVDEIKAPAGCEFVFDNRFPVIVVHRKRGAVAEGEGEAAAATPAGGATPAAAAAGGAKGAAPAAGAKAAAPAAPAKGGKK